MYAYTQKFLLKRRLALALPLLLLPFLTLAFWALGGGHPSGGTHSRTGQGLDIKFPTPELKRGFEDKLSLYEQASRDSMRLEEGQPDLYSPLSRAVSAEDSLSIAKKRMAVNGYVEEDKDPDETKLTRQLAELQDQWENAQEQKSLHNEAAIDTAFPGSDRYEKTGALVNSNLRQPVESEDDPELTMLDGMLDKILDIEHPEIVNEKLQEKSAGKKGMVYPVYPRPQEPVAELMEPKGHVTGYQVDDPQNGFFESNGDLGTEKGDHSAIPAFILETQVLASGATIRLQLGEDIYVDGILIPKGTLVYGLCHIEDDRLQVKINAVHYRNDLLPVSMTLYDVDGLEGIHIPGAISRDAAKQGMNQGIQNLNLYNMNASLGAQAASAGIQTIKSIVGGKVKLVKVTVHGGYKVLLTDNHKDNI